MTELERHIAKLLLDNDCVIVPGFGGFMAHHIAASYDEKSHIFLPPTRTVGFNPRLTMNDSVLAQDYVSCYDLSYPEALKRIESEVDEFRQMILGEDGGHEPPLPPTASRHSNSTPCQPQSRHLKAPLPPQQPTSARQSRRHSQPTAPLPRQPLHPLTTRRKRPNSLPYRSTSPSRCCATWQPHA